jgi:hypothetical protein
LALNFKSAFSALFRSSASGFTNYLMFSNHAQWSPVESADNLMERYHSNPVLSSVVNIKATAMSNMELWLLNSKDEIEPRTTNDPTARKIYKLLDKPNPLQSGKEFIEQNKIFHEVCGNSFTYANLPIGFKKNIENISSLVNVWPQYMKVKLTGRMFDALAIQDIVESWKFEFGTYNKIFSPNEIFHRSEPVTKLTTDYIFGTSRALALKRPLSNIELAYESRNVMIKNRGMRGIMSSEKGDATGKISLMPEEIKDVQDAAKKYGTLENQSQFFITRFPVNYTNIDQDVRKLGLFEEIASDAMIVCNAYGVPEILLKLYLSGATFENQEASIRRLYQDTVIPESMDYVTGLSEFLGLQETKFRLQGYFDHIPVMQKSEKDKATANKEKSAFLKELFMVGAITHNEWLTQLDLNTWDGGDKRIWEFEPAQIEIILRKTSTTKTDETN